MHSAVFLMSLYFMNLPSILLEICSGQKCNGQTDGRIVGRTDEGSDDFLLSLSGSITSCKQCPW